MQSFISYLFQAGISLAILHGIYRLFIRTETFHRVNRWILLGSLVLSALLPLISLPAIGRQAAGMIAEWDMSSLLLPVVVTPEGNGAAESLPGGQPLSLWQLAGWVYLAVSGILLIRLLYQVSGICLLIARSERIPQDGYKLVISKKVHTPFSFFRYVFLNPGDFCDMENKQVLDHEEVHSRQLHSADNLLAELYAVIFWFNPVSWWHKKEILLNLEYLADKGALQNGYEPRHYQLQLLKASLGDARYALANHFAQSVIKRRIKMMNTERSSLKRIWKYLMLVPAAALTLALLNCSGEMGDRVETASEDRIHSLEEVLATPDTTSPGNGYNFAEVDQKPVFPGGNDKIISYVGENFEYPAEAREADIEGTVYVQFTIRKDGSLSDVKAVRGGDLGGGLAEEALRVVRAMPAWAPGEHQGEKVAVSYTLPILCRLAGKDSGKKVIQYPGGVHSFAKVDKKPQFPGGNDKIMDFVGGEFIFPAEAQEKNIQGTVYVQFTIEKDGSVNSVRTVRGEDLGGGLAAEAERVVKSMPAWTPGEHQGEKVAVSYTLPIFCRIKSPAEKAK